jgi:hypothetical protein
MYLTNKYTKWYESIIAKAQMRVNNDGQYFEKHHIIPKSIGGTDTSENLVKLTPKEHFVCHMLLPKMTIGENRGRMIKAAWMIATMGNKYQKRVKVKSRKYCQLKDLWIKEGGLNKPKSEEHKRNISISKTNPSVSTRLKMSAARKAQTGLQTRSDDTKAKMSSWQKGVPKAKVSCEHCGKESSAMNYSRWHGDNCKTLR